MLRSLSPARRRFVLVLLGLALGILVASAGFVVVDSVSSRVDPVAQDRPGPVVLVGGYGGFGTALQPVADALEGTGRSVVVLDRLGGGTGDLGDQAAALDDLVDGLLDAGAPSVDVVGYSAGGVVARSWVADHGGGSKARRVLTIGSPHHGTDVAQLALDATGTCPTACRQLAPDSDFLRALNAQDETPAGPAFVSIWSEADRVVVPADSAALEGALNLTVQALCPGAGTAHGALPEDPAVIAVALAGLGSDEPRPPTGVAC